VPPVRSPWTLIVTAVAVTLALSPGATPAAAASTTTASLAVASRTTTPTDESHEVWTAVPGPNKTVTYTVYQPAPGVTAAQLHRTLAAIGTVGLSNPAADTHLRDPFSCYLETAYALDNGRCPPIRWTWSGYDDPQVYFRDHTPNGWPVREAVASWNKAIGVDSYWTISSCPGGSRHCVDVWADDYGPTGWSGSTTYTITFGRNFVDGSVRSKLNDWYATSTADRRTSACHEIGHALGVGHNMSRSSCMYGTDSSNDPQQPHRSDFDLLRRVIYP